MKIALVAPLSGRWARQGQLKKTGAEMAIAEINAQGGIKALAGAKLVLREADAGDTVEKAVSAAQRAQTIAAIRRAPAHHPARRAARGGSPRAVRPRLRAGDRPGDARRRQRDVARRRAPAARLSGRVSANR